MSFYNGYYQYWLEQWVHYSEEMYIVYTTKAVLMTVLKERLYRKEMGEFINVRVCFGGAGYAWRG